MKIVVFIVLILSFPCFAGISFDVENMSSTDAEAIFLKKFQYLELYKEDLQVTLFTNQEFPIGDLVVCSRKGDLYNIHFLFSHWRVKNWQGLNSRYESATNFPIMPHELADLEFHLEAKPPSPALSKIIKSSEVSLMSKVLVSRVDSRKLYCRNDIKIQGLELKEVFEYLPEIIKYSLSKFDSDHKFVCQTEGSESP